MSGKHVPGYPAGYQHEKEADLSVWNHAARGLLERLLKRAIVEFQVSTGLLVEEVEVARQVSPVELEAASVQVGIGFPRTLLKKKGVIS